MKRQATIVLFATIAFSYTDNAFADSSAACNAYMNAAAMQMSGLVSGCVEPRIFAAVCCWGWFAPGAVGRYR
ncbi:esterase, PHB depolymerase family protein [Burkholderiales bacterium GJ-E10]|nr:esterase, PHB depolymerase family protein [Burkholderiales bacterium GJ-E10]